MDKFNVIIPTANLGELDNEMNSWCLLPYDARLRSDEECIRTYGCTNWDLYNNIRDKILSNYDKMNIDKNNINIQNESGKILGHWENYNKLIEMSEELENSPYIVIINPSNTDQDILYAKYINYMLLNDKNKRISNDYSVKIWGINVPNMYARILRNLGNYQLDSDLGNDSNIVKSEEIQESAMIALENNISTIIMNGDFPNIERLKIDSLNPNLTESAKDIYDKLISEANTFDEIDNYLIQETPWFTHLELDKFDIPDSNYIYTVKEAMSKYKNDPLEINENEVLKLGWNPAIDINENSIKYAKQRQLNYLNENAPRIINLSTINPSIIEPNQPELFFNLYIVLNKSVISDANLYNKFGIAFHCNLKDIYTVNIKDNVCLGFANETLANYTDIEVLCIRIDKTTYDTLGKVIATNMSTNVPDIKIRSLYSLLAQTKNKFDPAASRLYYLKILDIIKELISFNNEMDKFEVVYNDKVFLYKVYSGLAKDYNEDNIYKIINILNCRKTREEFIINNSRGYNISPENNDKAVEIYKEMVLSLTPAEVIMCVSD